MSKSKKRNRHQEIEDDYLSDGKQLRRDKRRERRNSKHKIDKSVQYMNDGWFDDFDLADLEDELLEDSQ